MESAGFEPLELPHQQLELLVLVGIQEIRVRDNRRLAAANRTMRNQAVIADAAFIS